MRRAFFIAVIASVIAGCSGKPEPIVIGTKDFTEQAILSEIVRTLIESRDVAPVRVRSCGETFSCQQELRRGDIDLMIEYTGTGHLYSRAAAQGRSVSIDTLRESYQPLGLRWLDPLGFSNSYRVVISHVRASASDIRSIADLARLDEGRVRVACPPSYLRRPGDGLAALLQRHGLVLSGEPVIDVSAEERLDAVRRGSADIAILYATDGVLGTGEFLQLRDSLAFFPPYEAAILVRDEVLVRTNGLHETLGELSGTLSNEEMRRLNRSVDLEGFSPKALATRFLLDEGLIESAAKEDRANPPIVIAVAPASSSEVELARATKAVRETFPLRPVKITPTQKPIEMVVQGHARFAVLGAEQFFPLRRGRVEIERRVEASAVVGERVVHVFRRPGDDGEALDGRIGGPPATSSAGDVVERLLREQGGALALRAEAEELLSALRSSKIDAAVVLAPIGEPGVQTRAGDFELHDLPISDSAAAAPYLRAVRIPIHTYRGQERVIESMSVQVVLASAARSRLTQAIDGPAGALAKRASPLTVDEAERLAAATGILERPDPVLPSLWSYHAAVDRDDGAPPRSWIDTAMNVFTLAFIGWFLVLLTRPGLGASTGRGG